MLLWRLVSPKFTEQVSRWEIWAKVNIVVLSLKFVEQAGRQIFYITFFRQISFYPRETSAFSFKAFIWLEELLHIIRSNLLYLKLTGYKHWFHLKIYSQKHLDDCLTKQLYIIG